MSIRPPRDADFPALAAITNHYIETTAIHFAYEPLTADEILATWLGYGDRYPWLVSEEHGEVVGYAKAGGWRERRAYDWTVDAHYFHNGFAADLDAVIDFYDERFNLGLSKQEHADLVAFLGSL